MAGYGSRNRPAETKLTVFWAKALVLEDVTGQWGALITLDLVGIDRPLSQEICGLLADKFQLDRSQITIGTSHTHTGPVVGQNLSALHYRLVSPQQQALIDQNAKKLPVEVVNVVEQATDRLAPSQLICGSGAATFAVNRRNNREQDVPQLRADGQLVGPFDHDVPVLAVRDASERL